VNLSINLRRQELINTYNRAISTKVDESNAQRYANDFVNVKI
jgi:hypothetical protein